MSNNILKQIIKRVKNYKGVASAKGKILDYEEAHALQYHFFRGFKIIRFSTLRKEIKMTDSVDKWERLEAQYINSALTAGYVFSKMLGGGTVLGFTVFSGTCL